MYPFVIWWKVILPFISIMIQKSRVCSKIECPSTRLVLKSCKMLFVGNWFFNCLIILKFCMQHDSITAVLCVKFQNDLQLSWVTVGAMKKADFQFKISFGWIFHISTACINGDFYHWNYRWNWWFLCQRLRSFTAIWSQCLLSVIGILTSHV